AQKTAATILDGPWMYTNPTLQVLGKDLGVSPVGQFGPKKGVFVGNLVFVANKANSPAEQKAAMTFFEYFQKHSIGMAQAGPVPAYLPVIKSSAFKKLPAAPIVASEMKYGFFPVQFPRYDDHWMYDDAVWPAVRGKSINIKTALKGAAAKVTQH